MRILYVSQYFPPEMGAPAARVYELSRSWVGMGHEVTVLTGFPHHPTGVVPPEYRGEFTRKERVDGIDVLRVPIYASANAGVLKRSFSYFSYALSSMSIGAALTNRPDVLIATSPQMLTALSGAWLSTLKRVPYVFEIRDLWPQSIVAVGAMKQESAAIRILEVLERYLYRRADHLVTVTDSFVGELTEKGVPAGKIDVVKNGVDLQLFRPRPRDLELRRELGVPEDAFVSLYVGTHGMAHGLGTILEAARLLRDDPRHRFVLVGEGADKRALKERADALGLKSILFVDQQKRERIPRFLAAADVALVLLKDKPLFKTVLPSKIFEIMGAGRAIVLGVQGEARAVVEDAGAGVAIAPESATQLAATLRGLIGQRSRLSDMGLAGRTFVEMNYSRSALAQKYLAVLERVIGGKDAARVRSDH